VRHIADGTLRRLEDEPLAIPDRVIDHVAGCQRCRARRAELAVDAHHVAEIMSVPPLAPDTELAWARTLRELRRDPHGNQTRRQATVLAPSRLRLPALSLRAGVGLSAVGVLIAGTAAAATLTNVFSPTRVAPVTVSQGELRAISALMGLGDGTGGGGFSSPTGSIPTRFGTVTWSSAPPEQAATASRAGALAGFPVALAARLPAGVGAVQQFEIQPRARATVTLGAHSGPLAGSTVTLSAGPVVVAQYAASDGTGLPTLAIVTMPRPTARSTGADLQEMEAFLLRQPGVPPELSEQLRLLGDLRTVLPIPVPAGADSHTVRIDGQPGVLLSDGSNAAAGVVWEDGHRMVHVVAGILDRQDVLDVARQLG
jgi:hypothetical protein